MDKLYFYQALAQDHQLEISQEITTRHLLEGVQREALTSKQIRRLVLRLAPLAIVITILLLFVLLG